MSDAGLVPFHSNGRPGDAARREGRGAAGKGDYQSGLHDCKSTPCYFSLSKSHLDMMHKPLKGTMPARVPYLTKTRILVPIRGDVAPFPEVCTRLVRAGCLTGKAHESLAARRAYARAE